MPDDTFEYNKKAYERMETSRNICMNALLDIKYLCDSGEELDSKEVRIIINRAIRGGENA